MSTRNFRRLHDLDATAICMAPESEQEALA